MRDQASITRPRQIAQEAAQLARRILGAEIEVFWFGSWPEGSATSHADLDIATLQEIDLVDLHTVGETFRLELVRHGIRL